jgi:hypothetical protein
MTALTPPLPDLQIAFFDRLTHLRKLYLIDALLATVGKLDVEEINKQLAIIAPRRAIRKIASWGLRGELVFPVPCLLQSSPRLLGYYRLLLGFSQKEFYGRIYGLSSFKSMEEKGILSSAQLKQVESLCRTLAVSAQHLVRGVPKLEKSTLHDLTMLTLGPQLRGGTLNLLGTQATKRVFRLIKSALSSAVIGSTDREIRLRNAAGRIVFVEFSSDPDIRIREKLPSGASHNLVAVEIKGGRDISNVHNRIGEAEKSHQKARKQGFTECWTIVGVSGLDFSLARKESPSTDRFFFLHQILNEDSKEAAEFREELLARVGIKD